MKAALSLLITAAAFSSSMAFADSKDITLGSDAPAMQVKSWYKGSPVTSFDKNKTYVVEFWATWCGPCKQSIPHLTEMAKKNKDVTFVGVSIWEDDNGSNIKDFVKEMGDKMDYNVGYSGNKEGMSQSWMMAAGQNGIPTAFVIKSGKVQWIGHPMELEAPLESIQSGKYDINAEKAKFDKQAAEAKVQQAAFAKVGEAQKLYKSGKKAEAQTLLDEAAKANPQVAMQAKMIRLGWLGKDDVNAWRKSIGELAASKSNDDVQIVGAFAMSQLSKDGDKALGKEAIETALKATNESDFLTLYYGGMFYKETKDKTNSLRLLKKALDILPKTQYNNPQIKEMFEKEIKAQS